MDYLDEHFANIMANPNTSRPIRAAVGLGKWHLNKYYGLTDAFPACQIALSECIFPLCSSCLVRLGLACLLSPLLLILPATPAACDLIFITDLIISVLHPARRLDYLKAMRWEHKWIDNLTRTTRKIFEEEYAQLDDAASPTPSGGAAGQVCAFIVMVDALSQLISVGQL